MKSREELKEIARQILDYTRNDHMQIMSSLNEEELRALTPLLEEVTEEKLERERAEHGAFMRREREKDREHAKFLADTDRFIAEAERNLSRRSNNPPTLFPFLLGEA